MVGGHADEAYHDISPVEKVIGIHTFLLTFEGVDPSNIFSRIGFGRYENFNLLFIANTSFTKLWDDPESSNVWNGRSGLQMEVEVRERKNEFGDSEEVCRAMELALLFCGQPIRSTGVGGIMVLCVSHRYTPVLALRTSQPLRVRNPTTGMFFCLNLQKPISSSIQTMPTGTPYTPL